MKPDLVLGFTDYFESIAEFFTDILSWRYNVIRDDVNPKYLIFCDENFGQTNLRFNDKNVVKIFFTGENARPWHYSCHYAISFDHMGHHLSSVYYRLPLYAVDNYLYTKKLKWDDIRAINRNSSVSEKTGFCSFVVRNGNCKERNEIFHKLSEYKRVDSGGPLFNNMGEILSRNPNEFHSSKIDFLRTRKFNICYENSSYPGYVTEKLYHALYANTIPIYWGSPTVALDFNYKAFIDRSNFNSTKGMIEYIKELDNNDDLYNSMLQQPIFQIENNRFDLTRLLDWFSDNIYRG